MKRIVLLRHGESTWNKENRFTGWTDVDLTEKGIADAHKAGELMKEEGFHFDKAYTSFLKRAVKTLNCVLDKMDLDWIPIEKSWRLNEKHYGSLQGNYFHQLLHLVSVLKLNFIHFFFHAFDLSFFGATTVTLWYLADITSDIEKKYNLSPADAMKKAYSEMKRYVGFKEKNDE